MRRTLLLIPVAVLLVFSIGTIEHYLGRDQEEVLRRHAEFSQRWVLLAIPNIASPLFEAFLQAMVEDGTVYQDEHHCTAVPRSEFHT